jgi:hypothetical protein
MDEENLNPHGVAVGQRWKECDKRIDRTIKVIQIHLPLNGIGPAFAVVENERTGKKSKIALKNFRPRSRGYIKIEAIITNHGGPMS